MVSPLLNLARSGGQRNKRSPVGMTVVSPTESVSPLDARMTPTRKMLFQRRRLSSQSRNSGNNNYGITSPMEPVQILVEESDDARDDIPLVSDHIRSLASPSGHQRDTNQMQYLQNRFHHIQQGLGTIDEERNQLLERTKKLEKEKKLVQKQLQLREREILTLVKRCASQEEKMRESSKLRSENRELQHHLDSVKRRLNEMDDETDDLYSLKKKLQQSELDREHLQDRLAKLQREHDSVADTLQECLANIRQLTEEKQQVEEERRRERRRAELELEKQHLKHVADSNNLKEDIQMQQSKIYQLEKILQDNMYTNTALRREKAILSEGRHGEVQDIIQQYEKQLLELREQVDRSTRGKDEDYERQLARMKSQIEDAVKEQERLKSHIRTSTTGHNPNIDTEMQLMKEKLKAREHMIEDLETEFSEQMEELMSKQSSLDDVEAERRTLEEKVESMRNLETEHAALLDFVQILDSNLADLTSENAHLILEKDTLEEEAEGLRKQAEILQLQLDSLRTSRKARESDFRDLLQAENEEIHSELKESLTSATKEVASLQAEMETRGEWISMLESELRRSRRQIVEKEEEISEIRNEMHLLRSNLTIALRKARVEVAALESEFFSRDQNVASIEGRLEMAKEALESVAKSMDDMVVAVPSSTQLEVIDDEAEIRDTTPNDHYNKQTQEVSASDESELMSKLLEVQNESLTLQNQIETLISEKNALSEEVETSRGIINGRDDQILSLQQSILQHKKRENELEKKLLGVRKGIDTQASDIDSCSANMMASSSKKNDALEQDESGELKPDRIIADHHQRVAELEQNFALAGEQRENSANKLEEAHQQIVVLEQKLSGEARDPKDVSLEEKLETLTAELDERRQEAEQIETERFVTVVEQESKDREAQKLQVRVAELEQRIRELETTLEENEIESVRKDEMVSQMQNLVSEREEEQAFLQSALDEQKMAVDSMENEIASKCGEIEELQGDVRNARDAMTEKQTQITMLQAASDEKLKLLEEVEADLNEAKARIAELESDEGAKTTEQNTREIKELEEKIQTLLGSQTELATELEKSSNTLEKERMEWLSKEDDLEDSCRSLKAELVAVQGKLEEREIRIKKLQTDLEKNDEMYRGLEGTLEQAHKTIESLMDQHQKTKEKCLGLELELRETRTTLQDKCTGLEERHRQSIESIGEKERLIAELNEREEENDQKSNSLQAMLADAHGEIKNLELEIKTRGERIEKLQKEISQLNSSDIEIAFVESEKRRASLESDLAKAKTRNEELKNELDARENRLMEVDFKLESSQTEIAQKDIELGSKENKSIKLQKKVDELEEILQTRERRLMTVDSEMESTKIGSNESQARIKELETSNRLLRKQLEKALHEGKALEEAADSHKKDSEKFYRESSANDHKIKTLEDALKMEIQARNGLELDVASASETLAATQRQNDEIRRQFDEKCQALAIAREELAEIETSKSPSGSSLETQLTKLQTELALKDDEIRELRLVEMKDAEETIISLTEEINILTEEALKKNLEKIAEKASLTAEIERLNDKLRSLSFQKQSQTDQFDNDAEAMATTIDAMEASKRRLESTIEELHDAICIRDGTIKSLKESLSQVEQRQMEMTDERNILQVAEEEGREEVQNLKDEIGLAISREKEMAEIKLRNKDALHKDEMDHVLSHLEESKKKLREAEVILEERSNLLGEMVDQNNELECTLEREENDLRKMEGKFAEERVELERTKKELKKSQDDLRRKESVLLSKLKEERENKEFAEESLRKLKIKYSEAVRTKKCTTDLERQNAELRDKIRRQEAFLQRKIEKEKIERGRMTPTKGLSSSSQTKSVASNSTPTRRGESTGGSGRIPPPASNVFTVPPRGTRLPGPPRSASKKVSLSPATRSYRPNGTPVRRSGIPTSSDRSVTSELSSLLRSPIESKDQRDDTPVAPSWEMDLE